MLDVVTVFTYNAVINLAVMIVATIAWARNPGQKEIVFWALAAWAMVLGTICSSLTEHVPYNILGYVGGVIYVARTGLIRLGFKEFYAQPYRLWQAFSVSAVVCVAMVSAEVLEDPTPVRVSLIYLGSAINIGLGAQDLWRGKPGERLPSGRLSAMVYAVYALTSLAIVPLPILYPIQFEGTTPISDWLTYSSMLLLIFNLLAFLMAMVLKLERGGEIQRQLAERDHLTGLTNRRMFLHQAAKLSTEAGTAIAVLDLDHFKRLNDTYGHKGGDDALVQFAERTSRLLPADAVFGRLGGEEFGICLPNHDRAAAWTMINTIRLAVAAEDIHSQNHRFRLTLSCGLVVTEGPSRSLDAWMALADAGLYAAKDQGRNRVVLQEPPSQRDERAVAQPEKRSLPDWDDMARLSA
ncbi:MAG: GGDEF domain-containing protein [Rhizobium sp.]|nr:GGDEF domain-containing protein [Rhizobium sp.]